jgi:two-component system response regulator
MKRFGLMLVEDNENDELLTCRVLRRNNITDVIVVRDGAEALNYLFARGAFEGRDVMDQPAVVLLDLNLPKVSGLEVLKAIRADERTALMPVVIMTSSRQDSDLLDCYQHHANSYVVKPVDFQEFSERVGQLGLYWTLTNEPLVPTTIP